MLVTEIVSTALIGGLVVVNARLGLALGVLPFGHAQYRSPLYLFLHLVYFMLTVDLD